MRLMLTVFLFLVIAQIAPGQWQPCAGPTGGKLDKLLVNGDTVFAGSPSSIFISVNNGNTWVKDEGMPVNFAVNVFLFNKTSYFAGTNKGMFSYNFSEKRWSANTLEVPIKDMVYFPLGKGTEIYATDGEEIFRSPNNGLTWLLVNPLGLEKRAIYALGKLSNKLYVSTDSGIYISNEYRLNWYRDPNGDLISKDFSYLTDAKFINKGDTLFFGSNNNKSIFYTSLQAPQWINITNDLTSSSTCWNNYSIVNNEFLLSNCYGDMLKYNFANRSWLRFSTIANNHGTIAASAGNERFFFFSYDVGGIFRTAHGSSSAVKIGIGLTNAKITGLDRIGSRLFAGTLLGGAFISKDNGNTWTEQNAGLKNYAYVKKFVQLRDTVWSAVFNDVDPVDEYREAGVLNAGVYFLAPESQVWDSTRNIKSNGPTFPSIRAISLSVVGDSLIASTNNAVHVSEKGGAWHFYNHGKPSSNTVTQTIVSKSGYTFNNVYGYSIYRQKPRPDSLWEHLYNGLPGIAESFFIYLIQDHLFVGTDEGIFHSTDFGNNFVVCDSGIQRVPIRAITSHGSDIFAGGDNKVFWSKDGGTSWKNISIGLRSDLSVEKLTCDHDILFAGTSNNSVWKFPMASLYFPEVMAAKPEDITGTSVVIHPSINPNGYPADVIAEFSTNSFFVPLEKILADGSPTNKSGDLLTIVKNGLKENTKYYYRIIASNTAGRKDTSVTFSFQTKAYTRLLLNSNFPREIVASGANNSVLTRDSIEFRFSLNENIPGTKIMFSSRVLRGSTWKDKQLFSTGNLFSTKLGGTQIDELGAEYKIVVTPVATYSGKIAADTFFLGRIAVKHPLGFNYPGLKYGVESKDYNLLSFPLLLADKRPAAVFRNVVRSDDYDKTQWRLFNYVGEGGNYKNIWEENPDSILPGPGYWFAARTVKDTLKTGTGITVANHAKFDGYNFSYTLSQGYSLLGNPYPFDIAWKEVQQQNTSIDVGKLIGFETVGNTVVLKYLDILPKFGGGYINLSKNAQILIPAQTSLVQQNLREGFENIPTSLELQLKISARSGASEIAGIATRHEALNDMDFYDLPKPFFAFNFPLIVFKGKHQVTFDVRPEKIDGQFWEFTTENLEPKEEVILSWKLLRNLSRKKIILHDLVHDLLIDMEVKDSYSFSGNSVFRIFYGTKHYLDTAACLKNPKFRITSKFIPSLVTVNFELPANSENEEYSVQINILDLAGKKIKESESTHYQSGSYQVDIYCEEPGTKIIEVILRSKVNQSQKIYLKAFFI